MRCLKFLAVMVALTCAVAFSAYEFDHGTRASVIAQVNTIAADETSSRTPVAQGTQRYGLDAAQSKFIAHALAGGLFWFKGHDHLVAVREFSGEAQLNPDSLSGSSLQLTAKTASMEETSSVFTDGQKKIINKELREIVLLPEQYPDIIFKSTNVTGKSTVANQYDLKIAGELTLHGVTRPITIPTRVMVTGNDLRAQGEFSVNRSDFKVKATSAFHGLVRVGDKVKFSFDIVGHRLR